MENNQGSPLTVIRGCGIQVSGWPWTAPFSLRASTEPTRVGSWLFLVLLLLSSSTLSSRLTGPELNPEQKRTKSLSQEVDILISKCSRQQALYGESLWMCSCSARSPETCRFCPSKARCPSSLHWGHAPMFSHKCLHPLVFRLNSFSLFFFSFFFFPFLSLVTRGNSL